MAKTLKIYYLDENYINFLRKFDSKVAYNKNTTRPYIGIVYTFHGLNYFAPLSSPKQKHLCMKAKAIDIFKIDNGKLGIVNINNMIPTPIECISEVLPKVKDEKYKTLIENQTTYINNHKKQLYTKVENFRKLYDKKHLPENVMKRCCDFKLLEEKCKEYIEKQSDFEESKDDFDIDIIEE